MPRKGRVARIVRTTYYDDREARFVTIVWNGVRAKHVRHDRTVTDLAVAEKAGRKVSV